MVTRQIGKIIRGKATPLQIMMASILGAMLGFVPGWWEGPGLIVALTLLLIVLNANLAVAAIVGLLAKLVSFALLPVTFEAGRFLLDGPTQGLFKTLINAPGTALFGLEHYLTTGGVVVGFVFGLVCGLAINAVVGTFRRKMSTLEVGSELYQKWASKRWVKIMAFVFVGGGKGKKTYADLLANKSGNPIRILGVVFAVLVVALLWIAQTYLSGPILTMSLRDGLERANGATVDLGNAEVDLRAGKMVVSNLAMADPNALDTDLLRATTIEADISANDLLRKRVQLDRVVLRDATSGDKRKTPGQLIGGAPEPLPPVEPAPNEKTIEDWINQGKEWKQRLAQLRDWLEKLSGPEEETQTAEQKQETLEERIKRQIRESGYASVKASHLIEGAPTLVVTRLIADGVKTSAVEGEVFDIDGKNLSTHPRLLAAAPSISVKSQSGKIVFNARMSGSEATAEDEKNRLRFTYLGLPVDSVSQSLKLPENGASPISGGTMDIDIRGNWATAGVGHLDLPLRVTLHDTTLSIPKVGAEKVNEMKLAFGLRGPMDNPQVKVDPKQLADALKAAGADALASHMQKEADKHITQAKDKATKEVTEKLDKEIGSKLGDEAKGVFELIPGSKKKSD